MKTGDIYRRVERLEQRASPDRSRLPPWAPANPLGQFHRVMQGIGVTTDEAKAHYEAETGRKIEPGDGVILRVIVEGAR